MAEESDLLDGGFDLFTVMSFFQFNDCDALHDIKINLLLWKVVVIVIDSKFNSDLHSFVFIYFHPLWAMSNSKILAHKWVKVILVTVMGITCYAMVKRYCMDAHHQVWNS